MILHHVLLNNVKKAFFLFFFFFGFFKALDVLDALRKLDFVPAELDAKSDLLVVPSYL